MKEERAVPPRFTPTTWAYYFELPPCPRCGAEDSMPCRKVLKDGDLIIRLTPREVRWPHVVRPTRRASNEG